MWTGLFANLVSDAVHYVKGIDYSQSAIKLANEKFKILFKVALTVIAIKLIVGEFLGVWNMHFYWQLLLSLQVHLGGVAL